MKRLPPDAYQYFASLDPQHRSYEAVAQHFGVSKRAVGKKASKEQWKERLAKVEAQARDRFDEKLTETLEAVNARHVKAARFILAKGIEALRSMPLQSAMSAVRAIEIAIKVERLVVAEPDLTSSVHRAAERQEAANDMAHRIREAVAAMQATVPRWPSDGGPEAQAP